MEICECRTHRRGLKPPRYNHQWHQMCRWVVQAPQYRQFSNLHSLDRAEENAKWRCSGFQAVAVSRGGRSHAVAPGRSLFAWHGSGAGANHWALTALSGQQDRRCFCQKQQQWAAGGTATATPGSQAIQSSCCQHPRPREKVKALIISGFQQFSVAPLLVCWSMCVHVTWEKDLGCVRNAPGYETTFC